MNRIGLWVFAILAYSAVLTLSADAVDSASNTAIPVLVELFTSEGCSSCPPADKLLQELDTQPFAGAHLIVLSEHVDYWNHIGWTDPYSSSASTDRQNAYGQRFRLQSVYTPQMIVDGTDEFVGNSPGEADKVFGKASAARKIPLRISGLTVEGKELRAHLESGPLPENSRKADVFLVVALNHAESEVKRGENAGHRLTHVAVVRNLTKVGSLKSGDAFSQDVSVKLASGVDSSGLRVIAFIQEPGPGRVVGAAEEMLVKQGASAATTNQTQP